MHSPVPAITDTLAERYAAVRAFSESLCEGLVTEDYVVQSMTDVSPTKWHLAHTTWFFETFVLREFVEGYKLFHPRYPFLFNSYYVQAGERHCRAQRGYLSRPTVEEIFSFRRHVNEQMAALLDGFEETSIPRLAEVLEIGLNHEQQHQELMLTDIKHVFSVNPLRPVYREKTHTLAADPGAMQWVPFEAGLHEIGFKPSGKTAHERFNFDNEGPRHRAFVEAFELGHRLVTCGEYLEFMEDGGYGRPELWLSEGWTAVTENEWSEPYYWEQRDGTWWHFTLLGMRPVDPHEPLTHISYFEADAFARWVGARLPSEFEWEVAANSIPLEGHFVDAGRLHPAPVDPLNLGDGAQTEPRLLQLFGDAWQWTQSQYSPYPGYRPVNGALGEYNGKWMSNQFVLRGGSCATSRSHIRRTYRNFFHAASSWQFTGIRLSRTPN